MRKSTKTWLAVSLSLAVAGLSLIGVALALGGSFERAEYLSTTVPIEEAFDCIRVDVTDANVSILPATDGQTRVTVVEEKDKLAYDVGVTDGTLTVTQRDTRTWLDFVGFRFHMPQVTLYVTPAQTGQIEITTESGNVTQQLPDDEAESAAIETRSGNVTCCIKRVTEQLRLKTSSGNITATQTAAKLFTVQSSSGNIDLSQIVADTLRCNNRSGNTAWERIMAAAGEIYAKSGNVDLERCTVNLTGKTSSGRIRLRECVGDRFSLETSGGNLVLDGHTATEELRLTSISGNITATLLVCMQYDATSRSGNITCPASTPDSGHCICRTESGNIRITEQS